MAGVLPQPLRKTDSCNMRSSYAVQAPGSSRQSECERLNSEPNVRSPFLKFRVLTYE